LIGHIKLSGESRNDLLRAKDGGRTKQNRQRARKKTLIVARGVPEFTKSLHLPLQAKPQ